MWLDTERQEEIQSCDVFIFCTPSKTIEKWGNVIKKNVITFFRSTVCIFSVWGWGGGRWRWSSGDNADQSVVFNGLRHLLKSPLLAWRLHIGATGRSQVLEFHPYETSGVVSTQRKG